MDSVPGYMIRPLPVCLFAKILVSEDEISMIFQSKLLYDVTFLYHQRMPGNVLLGMVKKERLHKNQAGFSMAGEKGKNFIIVFIKFSGDSIVTGINFYRNIIDADQNGDEIPVRLNSISVKQSKQLLRGETVMPPIYYTVITGRKSAGK